jgi:hypothetical protein
VHKEAHYRLIQRTGEYYANGRYKLVLHIHLL